MGGDTIEQTVLIYPELYKVRYNKNTKKIVFIYGWGGADIGPQVIEKLRKKLF